MEEGETVTRVSGKPRPHVGTFFGFLAFSVLNIGVLFFTDANRGGPKYALVMLGAVLFPILTVVSGVGVLMNWSDKQLDRAAGRTLLGTPLILIGFLLVAWAASWIFGWFASIPSWAGVIIVLLILIIVILLYRGRP